MNDLYSPTFYLILLEFIYTGKSSKDMRLEAVTHFQGLGEFYEVMKNEGRQRHREIDPDTKDEICRYIFNSQFFNMDHRVHVSMTEKTVRKELKKRYRHIFNEFYKTRSGQICFQPSKREYVHLNPDVDHDVAVGASTHRESVFVCLVRHTLANTIRQYFVSSDDYNVNGETNAFGINDYIAGRFVFSSGYADKLIMVALAEETAQPFVRGAERVEKFYLRKRKRRWRAQEPEQDPMCALSSAEKLRLCAIVMGSSELTEYQFEPQHIFLDETCIEKEITFRTQEGLRASTRRMYKEWLIGCKPKNVDNEYRYELLYVSRGYAANCAFVYKLTFGFLYLDHFVDNVSVLPDESYRARST